MKHGLTVKINAPNSPEPLKRLETLQKLKEEGFHTGVAFIPVLPFISDSEQYLDEMIKTAGEFQADYVFVGPLTLQGIGKQIFYRILEKHCPELLQDYIKPGGRVEKMRRLLH